MIRFSFSFIIYYNTFDLLRDRVRVFFISFVFNKNILDEK